MLRPAGEFNVSLRSRVTLCLTLVIVLSFAGVTLGQFEARDPGVRSGPAAAGGMRADLPSNYQQFFEAALLRFQEVNSVSGNLVGSDSQGLGPRFNGDSCAGCHIQPAVGGTSPALNPQIAFASVFGASNKIPSFIQPDGPVREARFVRNPNGTSDGSVHDLFTITGMADAGACSIAQPDFEDAVENRNVIFRIPTPLFGLGLVEEISDDSLAANMESRRPEKLANGIHGTFNRSGNDQTITRFGWKAQNKSLMIFAGEAYNVEMGVTNELFPNERPPAPPSCRLTTITEDGPQFTLMNFGPSDFASDASNFAAFMRLSAPPTPAAPTPSTTNGQAMFARVGCDLCHTSSINTGVTSSITGDVNVPVPAFSDFELHHMGENLQDGVTQGLAGPDQFRTAPLWD
jgi:CxxC motif-containing protein (DUF1111 family)